MKNDSCGDIRRAIDESNKIIISGHVSPDGDAIGATCALALSLRAAGKEAAVLLEELPDKYMMLPVAGLVAFDGYESLTGDLFMSLDCGDKGRLGGAAAVMERCPLTVNIDHHESNTFFCDINFVMPYAASTSEMIFDLIDGHYPMNEGIASLLYAGILYDTGGFRHSSTNPGTMRTVARLMEEGIPFTKIYNRMFYRQSFSETKATGVTINNAVLYHDGEFIFTRISLEEIAACNTSAKELDGISAYMKRTVGTKVSAFAREKYPKETKVSFRADGDVDVCALAKSFGGGGHYNASGCTRYEDFETACGMVIKKVNEALDEAGCVRATKDSK